MKECVHCRKFKDEEEFAWSNKLLRIRQKHCRVCMSKFNKASYAKKGEREKQKIYDNRRLRGEAARQYVWDYLSTHPCVDCGETDPRLLEFDHINPKTKIAPVSALGTGRHSIKTIQREIAKCVVRCVSCHRKKTYKDRDWFTG